MGNKIKYISRWGKKKRFSSEHVRMILIGGNSEEEAKHESHANQIGAPQKVMTKNLRPILPPLSLFPKDHDDVDQLLCKTKKSYKFV